jgi:hypothetical protein
MEPPYEKGTNPKDAIGSDKIPMHLWPTTATIMGSLAMLNGACKYGRSNFRAIGVRSSIYYDAARRHLDAWWEGEEHDPDDGVPHLSAALACIAIIVDAQAAGKLNDDRMVEGGYREFIDKMTKYVKEIKDRHADRTPRHYTIDDNEGEEMVTLDQMDEAYRGRICIRCFKPIYPAADEPVLCTACRLQGDVCE